MSETPREVDPAPWSIDADGVVRDADSKPLAFLIGLTDRWSRIVAAVNKEAAADEILAALKAYAAWADPEICTDPILRRIREQIRAAIARAEGRTS